MPLATATEIAKSAQGNSPRVLVIDIGGSTVKLLASGQMHGRSFPSGETLTPETMVKKVEQLTSDWMYNAVSIGYPGAVLNGRAIAEPRNLGRGWIGFDFEQEFGCPVKLINDAAMQALGSYEGGKMLFLGLGTGLGTALIIDGVIAPMEIAHLPYRNGTYEDYVGITGLKRLGAKKWRRRVSDVVDRLTAALQPDETVIGGGNIRKVHRLPPNARRGKNANAFRGGFRLWTDEPFLKAGSSVSANARNPMHKEKVSPRKSA